ncbi:C-Jun-amino-terminal kinase-interacting protein 4-like isoform X1 [Watersipora subatra]|uniref:C-Jun-amino-terminal kinase-interacting protein 4-like isoform X1 n=1 Tax=Watersipora subatra TaxID=2589382 RepID=UPI00355B2A05
MEEETFGDFNSDSLYDSHNESMDTMSDMVQSMATQIYAEFERLIETYGDSVVEGLMPQLVAILENWDKVFKEKQNVQLDLDLAKEDNDQLLAQYEREKQLRKAADQRNMETEDVIEEQKKVLQIELDEANKNCKILEIKSRNYQDQVSRLEEKEAIQKAEFEKLHDRYTELFKSHVERMEKTKAMMSSDKSDTDLTPLEERLHSKNIHRSSTGGNFVAPPSPESGASQSLDIADGRTNPSPPVDLSTPSAEEASGERCIQSEISSERRPQDLALSLEAAAFDELDPELDTMAGSMVHPGEFASAADSDSESDDSESHASGSSLAYNGMTKEVENLIKENQELIQTKNALNVVKDDLIGQVDELTGSLELTRAEVHTIKQQKEALLEKISGLEEDVKQLNAKQLAAENKENEEDIPRAQRKRFTRVEMARVLMERNQYKERLMELQEAVRWTEMIRASKENPESGQKKKSSIWSLFSNLFAGNSKTKKLPSPTIHYNAPATHLHPVGDPNKPRRLQELSGGEKGSAYDFLQEDPLSEEGRKQKEAERRDKYRQVHAYVTKDDGRVQAYGWSVPAQAANHESHMTVPVPVYCRPLISAEDEQTALWCAAAVFRSAGRTRDGGSIVGAHSMFYSDSSDSGQPSAVNDADESSDGLLSKSPNVAQLDKHLKNYQRTLSESTDMSKLTSLVWLCTTTGSNSKVQVINAGNPAQILESFDVPNAHILTIASIPGVSESDYPPEDESHDSAPKKDQLVANEEESDKITIKFVGSSASLTSSSEKCEGLSEKLSTATDGGETSSLHSVDDGIRKLMLPTMWLGLQNGTLLIHSSMDDWKTPIKFIDLGDCILSIVHASGKVFVGLANGTLAVFHRNSDGAWCFGDYHMIDLGEEKVPIRSLTAVANSTIWIGHRNKVYVINASNLLVTKSFEAHPEKDCQVRLMAWCGDGVWVAIRNDTTLRLFNAHTLEHLQDIDIQCCVDKLLVEDKRGLSRVTSLELSCNRLWIGTGNGIIISVPLTKESQQDTSKAVDIPSKEKPPGGAVRVYSDAQGDDVAPATFVPYCDLSLAQLSYHGHRDCIRFFSTIAGNSKDTSLVMSGGEGYIDFRVALEKLISGDEEPAQDEQSPAFWSHLIVWEVSNHPST